MRKLRSVKTRSSLYVIILLLPILTAVGCRMLDLELKFKEGAVYPASGSNSTPVMSLPFLL